MNDNPYQAPTAELVAPVETGPLQIHAPRTVGVGRGVAWWGEGWQLFAKAPLRFTAMMVVTFLLFGLLSVIPAVGALVATLVLPYLSAGFYWACRRARDGKSVSFFDLFEPFNNTGRLLLVGVIYMAICLVLEFIGLELLRGMVDEHSLSSFYSGDFSKVGRVILISGLTIAALSIPLMMAFMYAPLLAHQHDLSALDAIAKSFQACLRNILPFLIWSLVWLVAFVLLGIISVFLLVIPVLGVVLPFLVGLIILPLMMAHLYIAFEDIFMG